MTCTRRESQLKEECEPIFICCRDIVLLANYVLFIAPTLLIDVEVSYSVTILINSIFIIMAYLIELAVRGRRTPHYVFPIGILFLMILRIIVVAHNLQSQEAGYIMALIMIDLLILLCESLTIFYVYDIKCTREDNETVEEV